jgi:NAD(P)-dependent dehydrogenase (short-subunit alcohol dehydrogenase family)
MAKTWFITGANRGLGLEIAKCALRAGHNVVAAGRSRPAVEAALGPASGQLLPIALDVSDPGQAQGAVEAAISSFGGIDVLVNNAGYGHMGFFEELTMQDAQAQFATNFFGVLGLTWAALPSMRARRSGHIFNISSLAGLLGAESGSLYCASKFALEGYSESLAKEIAPFGLALTIVEPGPFRTDFLTAQSLRFGSPSVADYDSRRAAMESGFAERNGKQAGDPAKLAQVLLELASHPAPPMRFLAGSTAFEAGRMKLASTLAAVEKWEALSKSTDGDYDSVYQLRLETLALPQAGQGL